MRVNLDVNRVQWRRYFEASSSMNMITAMSVNSAGTSMVVVGSKGRSYHEKFVFIIWPQDGGHVTEIRRLKIGDVGVGEHQVHDSGIVYAPNGMVYIAFKQESPVMRNSANSAITNYAGRKLVGAFNPETEEFDWVI